MPQDDTATDEPAGRPRDRHERGGANPPRPAADEGHRASADARSEPAPGAGLDTAESGPPLPGHDVGHRASADARRETVEGPGLDAAESGPPKPGADEGHRSDADERTE